MAQVKIEEIMGIGGKRKLFFLWRWVLSENGVHTRKWQLYCDDINFLDKPIKDLG